MKALELEKGLILKEKTIFLDRAINQLTLIFEIKVKYGAIATKELSQKEKIIQVDIDGCNNLQLWKDMKDISIEDLMQFILDNKDFKYLQTDETKTEENQEQFKYLESFYNTVFPYLQQFDDIKIIDI